LRFLAKYDSISLDDRGVLSVEAVALAAELNIDHLWGSMFRAVQTERLQAPAAARCGANDADIWMGSRLRTIGQVPERQDNGQRDNLHSPAALLSAGPDRTRISCKPVSL